MWAVCASSLKNFGLPRQMGKLLKLEDLDKGLEILEPFGLAASAGGSA